MKKTQLRIGNLISRLDIFDSSIRIEKIIELGKKALTTGPINVLVEYDELTPIKITKQWFYELGFNTNTDEGDELTKNGFDVIELNNGNFELLNHDFPVKIEYVHQLQNLYFALTGNELDYA